MKNYQKMLITFDELSVELSNAIKKNGVGIIYSKIDINLPFKLRKLIPTIL